MKKVTITALLLILSMALNAQSVTLEVDSAYINLGEWTTFTVTATGDFKNLKYTEPKDLTIDQIGKSTSYRIVNGDKTKSYILKYRLRAEKEGTLTLPYFYTEDSKGHVVKSEEQTIYVTKQADSTITEHNINSTFETPYVKLYIEVPERTLYVGEAIPCKIVAYFSTNYQPGIQRAPYIKTGSFILDTNEKYNNNLPEVVIDGQKWLQVAWDSHLTPLKSGTLDIEAAMDSYIEKPTGGSGFFTSTNREEISTSTELESITISPLPMENRPESFTGAIGEFSLNSAIDRTDAKVGDPLTVTIDIFGSGNFQRISMPKIDNSNQWKLYPESSTYKGSNGSNYKGVKSFTQILSPKSTTVKESPSFNFSYFDPEKGGYIELKTDKTALNITPGEFQNDGVNSVIDTSFKEQKESMRHQKMGNRTNYNQILNTPYTFIAITLALLFIVATITIKLLELKKMQTKQQENTNWKKLLKEAKRQEDLGDYISALKEYKRIISIKEASRSSIIPEAVTTADIENPLFKEIFIALDEISYTGKEITLEKYLEVTKDIDKELQC